MKQTHTHARARKTQPIRLTITTNPTNLINFPWTIINIFSNQDFLSNQTLYNSDLIKRCLKFSAQHFLGNLLSTQTHEFSYEINLNTNQMNDHSHINPKKKTLHQSNNQTHHHTTNQLIKRVRESQRLGENNPPPLRGSLEQMSAWIWVKRMSFTITTNGTCLLVCPTLFRLHCLPLFSHSFKSNGGRSFFTHTTSISKCQLGKKNVIVNKKMICLVLVRNCNWKWNWKRVRESKHVTKD